VGDAEWPATLGHEIFGWIEQAPPDSGLGPGRPVVVDSRIPCAECAECRAGRTDACAHIAFVGEARPGGFASHCVLPLSLLHTVPEGLDGSRAVLAEPLAVALHGLSHVRVAPARAAILGHGPIGALLHIELRRRFPSAEIEVAEPAALRASLARALGARCVEASRELEADGFDLVLDAAGYRGSLLDGVGLCRHGADLVILALSEHEVPVRPMELVEKGLRITGSNAFRGELPVAIGLLADDAWRYDPVITDAIDLADLPDTARRQLERPDGVKVLVRP
jgi:threonine dehydrogenase-like Zn-dependent dehydrogenase